jgi:hypothetical protein
MSLKELDPLLKTVKSKVGIVEDDEKEDLEESWPDLGQGSLSDERRPKHDGILETLRDKVGF